MSIARDVERFDSISSLIAALGAIAALDWRYGAGSAVCPDSGSDLGRYDGTPSRLELLADGRSVRLLAELAYTGPDRTRWSVPAGAQLDGESLPQSLRPLLGDPFDGPYRDASIVHDHHCAARQRGWRETHRMLHDAMRCSGVPRARAKIIFYLVYRFGPRWGDAVESRTAGYRLEPLSERLASALACDAETIHQHDLDLDEIERLADMRDAEAAADEPPGLETPTDGSDAAALARLLSIPGGRGTAGDAALIAARAALLPKSVLTRFRKKGIRIIACHDSVTDFERELRGVVPRGWESTGKTWDDVPGAYLPSRKGVVVATVSAGSGRAIPGKGSGHGSCDLLVHEALHGFDFISGHAVLDDPRFRAARTSDFNRLDAYERQAGEAGLQETYAESGARFIVEPARMAESWPALHAYWLAGPRSAMRTGGLEFVAPDGAIGTIALRGDGALDLDLRAESDDGAIGHAQFTISPGDAPYRALKSRIGTANLETPQGPTEPRLFFP